MGNQRAEIHHPDGRVELADDAVISASPYYNHDLAPVGVAQRTWTTYNYAALWISMAHCIPSYMLASGLIGKGMDWKQALFTILLGNLIVLVPILLNSHPGTKYGIPFPVLARASYGVVGSNVPALMRAVVACGWFGIQTWLGGEALKSFVISLGRLVTQNKAWADPTALVGGHSVLTWVCFAIFWAMNIWIIFKGMDLLRTVENWAAPFVMIMTGFLCVWIYQNAGGLGPVMDRTGTLEGEKFWHEFLPALMGMISFWATLSLNMSDFTRFGRSQKEQAVGQVVALPSTMVIFAAMGVFITSGAQVIFRGKLTPAELNELWDPMKLALHFDNFWAVAIAMFTVVIATLAVNIAANVVSPANDFANAFPRYITFRTGGLITGIVGILMMPWKLLESPDTVFKWLDAYGGGLGAIAGVMIVDYWWLRKRRLYLADLYLRDGVYDFDRGWHWPAFYATLWGCLASWAGYIPNAPGFALSAALVVLIAIDCLLPTMMGARPTGLVVGVLVIRVIGAGNPKPFMLMSDAAWIVGLAVAGLLYVFLTNQKEREPVDYGVLSPSEATAKSSHIASH